jgi:RNA polymerase sigma factor (sigma-70 family)
VKGVDEMGQNSVRPADEVTRIMNTYGNMIFRICLVILGNEHDAEDAVQDTVIRFMTKAPGLMDSEHEKAWLIRTATNLCKDMKRYSLRHRHLNIDDLNDYFAPESDRELIECVMSLPDKYKTILHLYYIEGYHTEEIAAILKIRPEAVRKRLQYARQRLKSVLEQESFEGLIMNGGNICGKKNIEKSFAK